MNHKVNDTVEKTEMLTESNANTDDDETPKEKRAKLTEKKHKSGIIYLSRIPRFMNVKILKERLSKFGEVGRIFLQVDEEARVCKKGRLYKEGWVEFKRKNHAKLAARMLNGEEVSSKPSAPWAGELWNMKYLPKFLWTHLGERLAYERAVHKQRLQTELSKAKREASFRVKSIEKSEVLKRIEKRIESKGAANSEAIRYKGYEYKQNETEDEILKKKQKYLQKQGNSNPQNKLKFGENKSGCSKIFSADRKSVV